MENNNKKTLILSIIGILVLVIAVIGVSFAMFTFTGTGTKDNVIKTGTITIKYTDGATGTADNKIELDNTYPQSDALGSAATDNKTDLAVTGEWGSSAMTINYELGITDISAGATLTSDYVKVRVLKGSNPVVGTANTGVTIASLQNVAGPNGLVDNYYLTGGTMTASGTVDTYTIQAWVSDQYDLAVDPDHSDTQNEGNLAIPQQDGSAEHIKTTKSETYSFKVTVVAEQA